jgi:hypothetical protein
LILIDHDELKLSRIPLADGRRVVEEVDGLEQEIVEVERTGFLERPHVAAVQLSDVAILEIPAVLEDLGSFHAVLRMADATEHVPRLIGAVIETCFLDQLFDHRLLIARIVDHEVARETNVRRLASQQARTQRVERRDPHRPAVRAEKRLDAVAHLCCGLIGERDSQKTIGRRNLLGNEIGDAMRDDARLAGSRAGKNQERTVCMLNGSLLFRIQRGEEIQILSILPLRSLRDSEVDRHRTRVELRCGTRAVAEGPRSLPAQAQVALQEVK